MKKMRKWLLFLMMARTELKSAWAELSRIEKEWEPQHKQYYSIILRVNKRYYSRPIT